MFSFQYNKAILSPLLVLVFSVVVLFVYVPQTLMGDFDKHVLPSKMFGVPESLEAHGFEPLYSEVESGWDGQFYYYIANDIFALKDTPDHIDAAAYRYQRIGLPLLANIVSKVTFQSWVSPTLYYLTSLGLILVATFMAAQFFASRGVNPLLSLVWALGFGTQVTMLNGLPDAAADALLIIALISLVQGRHVLYMLAILFAALTREAYVLVPVVVGGAQLFYVVYRNGKKFGYLRSVIDFLKTKAGWHVPAVIAVIGWQGYLRFHFGVAPSSQAAGILGLPFAATMDYMWQGLNGVHPLFPDSRASRQEGLRLIVYLSLLAAAAVMLVAGLKRELSTIRISDNELSDGRVSGLYGSFLVLIALYTAFGPTVMMHPTGYLKAANIFLFVIPFVAACRRLTMGRKGSGVLVAFTLLVSIQLLWDRIDTSPGYSNFSMPDKIEFSNEQPECITSPNASIEILESGIPVIKESIFTLFSGKAPEGYMLKVTNTSGEVFSPYRGAGAVNVSYNWFNANGDFEQQGRRGMIRKPLQPAESDIVSVVVEFPENYEDMTLRFSLVQEGCFWFHERNPEHGLDVKY